MNPSSPNDFPPTEDIRSPAGRGGSEIPASESQPSSGLDQRERYLRGLGNLLRGRWAQGQRISVEQILVENPLLTEDPEAVFELLRVEYDLRRQQGDEPSLDEYHSRFPSHVPQLTRVVRFQQALQNAPSYERDSITQFADSDSDEEDTPPTHSPTVPRLVGGYEILEEIGRGGMGVVFKARHREMRRVVALKMILSARLAGAEELVRFRLEGETAASLQHPNIVQVFEVGTFQDQPYLVMEYIEGGTLAQKIRGHRLTPDQAARLIEILARAVHTAHIHGIVHRDLKPGNILLAPKTIDEHPFGTPKITDFGLAKHLDRVGVTETGRVLGTPEYMAPEQAAGRSRDIGPTTDVYSLGAILYELLSGRPPFITTATMNTMIQLLSCEAPPLRRLCPRVPRDLETICARCLEKDPSKRYTSTQELADDLRRFRESKPIYARPIGTVEWFWKWAHRRPVVAGLLLALILVAFLGFAGVTTALFVALERQHQADEQRNQAANERDSAQQQRELARLAARQAVEAQQLAEKNFAQSRLAQARLEWRLNNLSNSQNLLQEITKDHRGWEWHYLDDLHRGDLRTITYPGNVTMSSIDFSPDGKTLLIGGGNPFIRWKERTEPGNAFLHDFRTGKTLNSLQELKSLVRQGRFSPDGKHFAIADSSGNIRICDTESGMVTHSFEVKDRHPEALSWRADSKQIVTVWNRRFEHAGVAVIWDLDSKKQVQRLGEGLLDLHRVDWSRDGRYLSLATTDDTYIYEVATGKKLHRFHHPSACVAFSPDSQLLAVASSRFIRLYDVPSGRQLHTIAGHEGNVAWVTFRPDGQELASAGADSTVRLWDVTEGAGKGIWRGHTNRVECVTYHPQGWLLASAGIQPGEVKLWDLTRSQEWNTITPENGLWIDALRFSPDGRQVLLQRAGGMVEGRDCQTGKVHWQCRLPLSTEWRVPATMGAFSRKGDLLAAVPQKDDHRAKVWKLPSGSLGSFYRHKRPVWRICMDDEGTLVASVGQGRSREWPDLNLRYLAEFALWNPLNGVHYSYRAVRDEFVQDLAMSRDGKQLATAVTILSRRTSTSNQTRLAAHCEQIHLWDIQLPGRASFTTPRWIFPLNNNRVCGLAFSKDGTLLAGGCSGAKVWILDCATGKAKHPQGLRSMDDLHSLAFSPDGRLLAGAGRSRVKMWDVETGQEVLTLRGSHPRPYDGGFNPQIAWSPDGTRLAASNWDHSVSVWDGSPQGSPQARQQRMRNAQERVVGWHLTQAQHGRDHGKPVVVRRHLDQLEQMSAEALAESLTPEGYSLRGDLYGWLGDWQQVIENLARLRVREHRTNAGRSYRQLSAALIRAGQMQEYEKLREIMRKQFPSPGTDTALTANLFMSCALIPVKAEVKQRLRILTDPNRPRGAIEEWHRYPYAMACVRAERYSAAIQESSAVLQNVKLTNSFRLTHCYVLAMAYAYREDEKAALQWWQQGEDAYRGIDRDRRQQGRKTPRDFQWWEWVELQLFRREVAEKLGLRVEE